MNSTSVYGLKLSFLRGVGAKAQATDHREIPLGLPADLCVLLIDQEKKNQQQNPAIESAHNRKSVEQNTRLSKTFFIAIGVSIAFWAPGVTLFSVAKLCAFVYPQFLNQ